MRRRLLHHLRGLFRIEPGKPALGAGLRAALAVTVPFTVASVLEFPHAGWTGLTGLLVTLADRGGSYASRARVMATLTLLGAAVGALAALAGGSLVLDLFVIAVGVFVAGFARAWGDTAGSVGGMLGVIFVASLGAPAVEWDEALLRGVGLLFGGGWATFQALLLWPLRPFRPARRRVAHVYAGLADAARELARLTRTEADLTTWERAITRHAPLRRRIEEARATLAETRRGRPETSPRGENLLVLLESSELALATLFALAQAMEVATTDGRPHPERQAVAEACDLYAARLRWVVASLERDPDLPLPSSRRRGLARKVRTALPPPVRTPRDRVPGSVAELLSRMENYARWNRETTLALLAGRSSSRSGKSIARTLLRPRGARSLLEPLRENLDRQSEVLRHALRGGIVAAAALLAARALELQEAHWVVLSAIGVLQPHSASTEERALQRGLGTLLGGTLAVGLAAAVSTPLALVAIIGLLTAISVSLLPLNFGAFQVLLTPDFLLLATIKAGNWTVAGNRAIGVVLACALAVAAVWLLWPTRERRRFAETAASALRADGRYLREVAEHRSGDAPEVFEARRDFGLALLDAEASFERLIAESGAPSRKLEPAMAVLTYSRRIAACVTALREDRNVIEGAGPAVQPLVREAGQTLESLAEALQEGRSPPPVRPLSVRRATDDPLSHALIERLPRQLGILHGAVTRLSEAR